MLVKMTNIKSFVALTTKSPTKSDKIKQQTLAIIKNYEREFHWKIHRKILKKILKKFHKKRQKILNIINLLLVCDYISSC